MELTSTAEQRVASFTTRPVTWRKDMFLLMFEVLSLQVFNVPCVAGFFWGWLGVWTLKVLGGEVVIPTVSKPTPNIRKTKLNPYGSQLAVLKP